MSIIMDLQEAELLQICGRSEVEEIIKVFDELSGLGVHPAYKDTAILAWSSSSQLQSVPYISANKISLACPTHDAHRGFLWTNH